MDWLVAYTVFALTTAICAWLFYFIPVVAEAQRKQIINTFTKSPYLSSIVYVVISTFIAPTIFVALFSKTHSKQFQDALRQEILKQD